MKGWPNESARHSLAARGCKTGRKGYRGRGILMKSYYEYETGQAAVEIAQGYVDSIQSVFPRLKDSRSYEWAEDRRKFRGYLMFKYDYRFDDNEITELQGVVMDVFRETKQEMKR